ncbi:MAG: hypothetical protein L6V35_02080 [Alistipes putredinis]|nr:MAG: hypothetical protein L6V35_02080 [Alistipes putredinis]
MCKAVTTRNLPKALAIADNFARNPKQHPIVVTLSTLFSQFRQIFIINYYKWLSARRGQAMPTDAEFCRILKVSSPFIVGELKQAAALYPNKKTFSILGLMREYDAKSKGIGNGGMSDGELLRELLLKNIHVLKWLGSDTYPSETKSSPQTAFKRVFPPNSTSGRTCAPATAES